MDFYQLRYFVSVIDNKNFRKAADKLGVTQPALSIAIKKLENELDVQLIDKDSKEVSCTEIGKEFYQNAKHLLAEADSLYTMCRSYANNGTDVIRLGLPFSFCNYFIPLIHREFEAKHPNILVKITQEGIDRLGKEIVEDEYDFVMINAKHVGPELEYVIVGEAELYACCSPDNPLAANALVTPEMLDNEYLLISKTDGGVSRIVRDYLQSHGRDHQYTFSDKCLPQDLLKMAENGQGVAVIDSVYASESHLDIAYMPLDPPLRFDICLAWQKNKFMSKNLISFKNFIKKQFLSLS